MITFISATLLYLNTPSTSHIEDEDTGRDSGETSTSSGTLASTPSTSSREGNTNFAQNLGDKCTSQILNSQLTVTIPVTYDIVSVQMAWGQTLSDSLCT